MKGICFRTAHILSNTRHGENDMEHADRNYSFLCDINHLLNYLSWKKIEFINPGTPAPAPYISHQFCPIFHQKLAPIPKRPNIPSLSTPQVSVINLFAPMSIPSFAVNRPSIEINLGVIHIPLGQDLGILDNHP